MTIIIHFITVAAFFLSRSTFYTLRSSPAFNHLGVIAASPAEFSPKLALLMVLLSDSGGRARWREASDA